MERGEQSGESREIAPSPMCVNNYAQVGKSEMKELMYRSLNLNI